MRALTSVALIGITACTLQKVQLQQGAGTDDHLAHMNAADMVMPPRGAPSAELPQGHPGIPASNNSAPARLAASPRHGEWVKIAWESGSADSLMAWVVYPMTTEKAPVVVVVHEIFGLSTWVRAVADQVAADGFIAIAPDFLSRVRGGPATDEIPSQRATQLIQGVNYSERNRAITAAANYGMTRAAAEPRYAVIGFCWGGSTSWGYAVNGGVTGFSGAVAFYGSPFSGPGTPATADSPARPGGPAADSLAKIRVPVMLLNGARDARIAAAMPAIDSLMKSMQKDYVGINYEGAIHGFMRAQDDSATGRNSGTEAANLEAAQDAWTRTTAFLRRNLGKR